MTTGAREAFLDGDERAVAKDLAFTRGDQALAIIWPGHFRAASWAFADPAAAPIDLPTTTNFSRVVARADGTLIAAGYGAIMTHIAPDGALAASQIADGGTLLDLAASDDGRSIAHLSSRGSVAVRAADGPERIIAADRAIAIALDATGATLAIASPGSVARFDARRGDALGAPIAAPSVGLVALALSPDGSRVAAGTLEGRVLVWDAAGALLMDGRAHTQRVSALAFTASGRHLISASWDGTAIRWDLGVLDVPVARLVERIEGAHGLDLAHAMRADLR
ncbi:MAG: hypothetical protein U1F43_21090 [Myxococcota bacterium]